MKLRLSLSILTAGIVALGVATTAHAQVTGQVYQLTMAGSVLTTEEVSPGTDVLVKGKFDSNVIINVARGRDGDALVPANEKLALVIVFDDPPAAALTIYDTAGQSNLTDLADLDLGGAIESAKGKGFIAMAGGLNTAGQFTGGWVALSGKATVTGENTATPQVSFSGAIQGLFRGIDDEDDFEVVVTKGKAVVVGRIGTVVIEDN